jgi:cyd operon protein YbgE
LTLNRPWARVVSLTAALAVSAVLMIYPYALGTRTTAMTRSALPLLLFGVSAAFVHGVGFKPDNRILRAIFSPIAAWPLIAAGVVLIALG